MAIVMDSTRLRQHIEAVRWLEERPLRGLWDYWQRAWDLARYEEEDARMPIIVSQGDNKTFEPAPEGLHNAVCVDVVDRGILPTAFGPKPKIDLIWQVVPVDDSGQEMRDKEGRRFQVLQRYTASLHAKSLLHTHLKAWRGKAFTQAELDAFDLEKLIGACCQLQLIHNIAAEGKVYANIQAVVPFQRGATKLRPVDYTRMVERAKQNNGHAEVSNGGDDDSDIPF